MSAKAPVDLSIIIALRDRSGLRLENCLRSLAWQDLPRERFEILLSDFGSSPDHQRATLKTARQHDACVIRTDTRTLWNKSKALNIAIREAQGRYVLCTDADMIFAPNFLNTLLRTQREADDGAFVLCQSRDLPESLSERHYSEDDLPELVAHSQLRARQGTGACQMATRAFFERVRGYDEGYKGWGQEDTDMTYRAGRSGLRHRWVDGETHMFHQWHPSNRSRWPLRKHLNDLRFHLTKRIIAKNPKGWGLGH